MRKKRSSKDASMPSFKLLDSDEKLPSTQECSTPIAVALHCTPPGHTVASTSSVPEKTPPVTSKHIERRSPRLSPEVVTPIASLPPSEELKILHKRAKDVSVVFKSPFIERNINVFSELTQLEKKVADYGFAEGLNNREVLFNCGIHKLHRYELKTMMCGEMVSEKVLHAWAHMLNEREKLRAPESPCRLYLSFRNEFITSTDCARLSTNIKISYMPANASLCKQVFLPLFSPNPDHWFLCVSDLTLKTNFILDSSPPRRTNVRNEKAATIVANVAEIISRTEGFERLKEISLFKYVNVKIPRQDNGADCGIYVIKWIEALMDHSLWTNKQYFKNLDEYRKNLVIKLLRWDKNQIKDFA